MLQLEVPVCKGQQHKFLFQHKYLSSTLLTLTVQDSSWVVNLSRVITKQGPKVGPQELLATAKRQKLAYFMHVTCHDLLSNTTHGKWAVAGTTDQGRAGQTT